MGREGEGEGGSKGLRNGGEGEGGSKGDDGME